MTGYIDRPSPNFDDRAPEQVVDILLMHYTGMKSGEAALSHMCDPAAKVSAHYCVNEDGTVYRLVDEAQRAWHAGVAIWAGASDINARSIGIELVNPGHEFGYHAFPEPQIAALIKLASGILSRHPIPPSRVIGHADVAPLRKEDPGELFPWARLADEGIGIWPRGAAPAPAPSEEEAKRRLAALGYGYLDEDFAAVVRAFQRHFRPEDVTGTLDEATAGRLDALLSLQGQSN